MRHGADDDTRLGGWSDAGFHRSALIKSVRQARSFIPAIIISNIFFQVICRVQKRQQR